MAERQRRGRQGPTRSFASASPLRSRRSPKLRAKYLRAQPEADPRLAPPRRQRDS